MVLEICWQLVRYLYKIGAVEGNDRAYLLYTQFVVYLTTQSRMMQVIQQKKYHFLNGIGTIYRTRPPS